MLDAIDLMEPATKSRGTAEPSRSWVRYNPLMSYQPSPPRALLVAVLFLCSAGFLSRTSRAQDQGNNFDLEGKITQQSKDRLTVDTGQGILFHVTFDDKTSIVRGDSTPGSEQDLKVGVKIHAIGDLQDSGEIKAQKIEIEAPDKSAKAPAAP